jgi:hypothetical protein
MTRRLLPLVVLVLAAGLTFGQAAGCPLTTTFAGGNGQSGNMFDIVATNPAGVTITGFDVFPGAGTWTFEIYAVTGGGSHVGNETNPGAWTLIGSASGITADGNTVINLPIPVNVTIPSGGVQGFYVTVTTPNVLGLNYTNGTAVGNVFASDANIQFLEGTGNSYPFGAVFQPRVFNGNIYYTYPGQVFDYQVNQPAAHLDINSANGSSCSAAVLNLTATICPSSTQPATGTLTLASTNVGQGFEVAMSAANLVPASAGALTLPDGQIVNLDLSQPLSFLNGGGPIPLFAPFPGGTFPGASGATIQIPFSITTQTDLSLQMVVFDPTTITGIALSQPTELHVALSSGAPSIPGPTGDDVGTLVDITAAPTCWAPNGMPFYTSSYNVISVESNGRVMMGATDSDFTATVGEALTDNPFVGYWSDLSPNAGGSVTITNPLPGVVEVVYANVPYFAQPGSSVSFIVRLDTNTGQVDLDGLTGIGPNPTVTGTGDNAFMGISGGNLVGATDPGPTTFTVGGSGTVLAPTDMWYDFLDYTTAPAVGLVPSLQAGTLNTIQFLPDGAGNYIWIGL